MRRGLTGRRKKRRSILVSEKMKASAAFSVSHISTKGALSHP